MPMIVDLMRYQHSDAPAYRCAEGSLSFRELIAASQRLAGYLDCSTPPGAVIAIYGHKERLLPIGITACAIANRPYLPIDCQTPALRANGMLRQADASLLLCAGKEDCSVSVPISTLTAERLWSLLNDPLLPLLEPLPAKGDDPFYLLFTSGSSGTPKGVVVTRKNVASFLRWERALLDTTSGPVLNQAAFSFDLSVADLWLSLTEGRCESVLEQSLFSNYPALFEAIERAAPTLAVLTPSFAELLLSSPSFTSERFPSLQELLFCGEPLHAATVQKLWQRFPHLRVLNSYGPTECTVAVTGCEITEAMLQTEPLPIGSAKPGVSLLVCGPAGQPLPQSETGELVIVGDSVAAGYLGDAPGGFFRYHKQAAYHTGDCGFQKDGLFYCTGRLDRQLKWRGVRIEPEEIEAQLVSLPEIERAAVLPVFAPGGKIRRLRAFVTLYPDAQASPVALRQALEARLPPSMIPVITLLSQMPINQNGKCDYAALKELP